MFTVDVVPSPQSIITSPTDGNHILLLYPSVILFPVTVATTTSSYTLTAIILDSALVWTAFKLCAPSVKPVTVLEYAPLLSVVAVPKEVLPSLIVIVCPLQATPSFVKTPVTVTESLTRIADLFTLADKL